MSFSNLPFKTEVKNFLRANFRHSNTRERIIVWSLLVFLFASIFICLIVSSFFTDDSGDVVVGGVGAGLILVFIISWFSITHIQRKIFCVKISREANKHFGGLYLLANSYFNDSIIEQKNMGTWTLFTWTGKDIKFEIKAPISPRKPLTITLGDKVKTIENSDKKYFCHKVSLNVSNIKNRSVSFYDFKENAIDAVGDIIANYVLEDFKNVLLIAENMVHENN